MEAKYQIISICKDSKYLIEPNFSSIKSKPWKIDVLK